MKLPNVKVKTTQPKPTQTPNAENTSPHESVPVPVRDKRFYDMVRTPAGQSSENTLSLDILNSLYDGWKIGCDDMEAAALAGVSYRSLTDLLREIPELKEIRDSVRTHPRVIAKTNVLRRLNNDPTGEFSLKYLEKVKPDEFGGKGAVININNTSVAVSDKLSSLSEFMSTFGGDVIDG